MKKALGILIITILLLTGLVLLVNSSPKNTTDVVDDVVESETAAAIQAENTILQTSEKQARLTIADSCLDLGIADTRTLRARGLSGQPDITPEQGLLFTYKISGDYGFWMKEMNFPIDIIWLDEDFEVITIKSGAQPESYPESFYPDKPARYVLELAAGRAEELGVAPGDTLQVSEPSADTKRCGDGK